MTKSPWRVKPLPKSRWKFRKFMRKPMGFMDAVYWGVCFGCGDVYSGKDGNFFYCSQCKLIMPWHETIPIAPWARVPTRDEAHRYLNAKRNA